jgi:hypothetical protein
MKPVGILFIVMLLLFQPLVFADDKNGYQETFKYRFEKKITLPASQGFFQLELDPYLFAHLDPTLRDLRLYGNGKELGFTGLPLNEVDRQQMVLTIVNKGFERDGKYSFEFYVPGGIPADKERILKVFLNPEPYFVKGELYGGVDGRQWKKIKDITLFSLEDRVNDISLTGIDYPYLKISFYPSSAQVFSNDLVVNRVQLVSGETIGITKSAREKMSIQMEEEEDNITSILVDLKYHNRLTDQITIQTGERAFYRQVSIEGSNDGEKWSPILSTYIYRGMEKGDEKLTIPYEPRYDRYLKIKIFNEDNLPLQIDGVEGRVYPVRVLVKAPQGSSTFTLEGYFGNRWIKSPSYDVKNVLKESGWQDYPLIQVKEFADNPIYNPNKMLPFTERYPFLITIGLILATGVVLIILYRTIKTVNKS